MHQAERLKQLPPYLFARLDRKVAEARKRGVDVISFGIGDPDRPTPEPVVRRLQEAATEPAFHRYPPYEGSARLRQAAARFMERRFGVGLDPDREVLALIGSKEGVAHLPLALVDPGSVVLVPEPGYPVYAAGAILAGGEPYPLPLHAERGYLPDLTSVPQEVLARTRLLWLNYPNNPTGATASPAFFAEAVALARRYDFLVAHDAAYSEVAFDGYRAPSILQVEGARDVALEIHSLSKTFNMTGWRLGWACGAPQAVEALAQLKSNLDSGAFLAVQEAGAEALDRWEELAEPVRAVYQDRRDLACRRLRELGWPVEPPKATFYLWIPTPPGVSSAAFAERVLEETGVVVTPGSGYGPAAEGNVRLSLCLEAGRIDEAFDRWARAGIRFR
ncbi:LL-diaminopimelate aminotransferase [Limnochorda pilosa]|uniref:Aminotransferase n=1 Tax=Limnochorda pilosa TaxID=1555112 RepID=A0A0K2SKE0_LIMPI|nr:LL-diaminopimelate aminotransferase [Limnochorda pilosa]BAS27583.1 diaminopimelate aminotransferase [Limnochorda pilosa]